MSVRDKGRFKTWIEKRQGGSFGAAYLPALSALSFPKLSALVWDEQLRIAILERKCIACNGAPIICLLVTGIPTEVKGSQDFLIVPKAWQTPKAYLEST